MDIKYIEVPIRVKPHTDYLDTKGVEELWIKIKEYVAEHGGDNSGSVNEDEVNALISSYYREHKDVYALVLKQHKRDVVLRHTRICPRRSEHMKVSGHLQQARGNHIYPRCS